MFFFRPSRQELLFVKGWEKINGRGRRNKEKIPTFNCEPTFCLLCCDRGGPTGPEGGINEDIAGPNEITWNDQLPASACVAFFVLLFLAAHLDLSLLLLFSFIIVRSLPLFFSFPFHSGWLWVRRSWFDSQKRLFSSPPFTRPGVDPSQCPAGVKVAAVRSWLLTSIYCRDWHACVYTPVYPCVFLISCSVPQCGNFILPTSFYFCSLFCFFLSFLFQRHVFFLSGISRLLCALPPLSCCFSMSIFIHFPSSYSIIINTDPLS
jgi:hypothetical protein